MFSIPTFFDQGIRFQCQGCGACCQGEPGTIFISRQELPAVARFLQISQQKLINSYLYPYKWGYSILEKKNGDCLFYDQGCLIYPVRPNQCRTFPFWFKNLRNIDNWRQVEQECPGLGQGPLYTKDNILKIVQESVL